MKKLFLVLIAVLAFSLPVFGQSSTKNVTVSWTDSTSAGVSYNIYLGTSSTVPCPASPASLTLLGSAPSGATSFADSNRAVGNVDCYVVTSLNASGIESVLSNVATVDLTRPLPPTGVTAVAH